MVMQAFLDTISANGVFNIQIVSLCLPLPRTKTYKVKVLKKPVASTILDVQGNGAPFLFSDIKGNCAYKA